MNADYKWIFSGIGTEVVGGLIGLVFALFIYFYGKKQRRVLEVTTSYSNLYKRNGLRLECLIPAGIHTLKSNREIRSLFKEIMKIEPHHPLRQWEPDVREIGYKEFFNHVYKTGLSLNKNTIDELIAKFKK